MAKKNDLYRRYRQKQNREIENEFYQLMERLGEWAGYYIWKGTKKGFKILKDKLKRKKQK